MSAIIENQLRHNKQNNERKSVIRPKPRRGALPPLSAADNIHGGSEERHFNDRGYTNYRYNNNDDNTRKNGAGFRRKNKKRK
ncbi:unnamed protein product [Onchocerca ochengi]|uniref:Uncharacterized protein n=1 Tax=Onchocerca ochengi TaxID=42157 RepID=A0A182EEM1_ONCOC|nr:unnamed protein product [Onchocerca ochengi]